jgi:uncharacterized membrane protein
VKIPEKLYLPAAIVCGCGLLAVGVAYGLSPPDARAIIVTGVGVAWGFVQTLVPHLMSGGGDK